MKKPLMFVAGLVLMSVASLAFTFFTSPSGSRCTLVESANAQDNPCLAQEATISALQFQNLSLQATMAAMSAQSSTQGGGGVAAQPTAVMAGLPLTETFDNNDRGWRLFSNEDYSVTLSRGTLALSNLDNNVYISSYIPNLDVSEFYIDVEVTPSGGGNTTDINIGYIGFSILANTARNIRTQTDFLVGRDEWNGDWYVITHRFTYDGDRVNGERVGRTLYSRSAQPVWRVGETVNLGFEARNGLYTLYINGESVESLPNISGIYAIGLAYTSGTHYTGSARFDNLTARQSR